MSFILQKFSSSDQLLESKQKIGSNNQLFSFKNTSLKNAKQLSEIQSKSVLFKVLCNCMHVLLVICVFLLTKFEQPEQQEILHFLSTMLASFSVIINIFVDLNQQKLKNKIDNKQKTPSHSAVLKIMSVLFYLIHPNYLTNNIYIQLSNLSIKLNELLSIIVCFRIFSLIVFCIQFSRFYGLRVARIADLYANKDKMSLKYAIKCLYKEKGLKMPLFMLFFGLIIICFIDVNYQRATNQGTNFLSSLYNSVITMTTVGYGDVYYSTKFERIKAIFLMILGSFISSVLTLTILNFCKFTQQQTKAYISTYFLIVALKRLNLKDGLAQSNKNLLKSVISYKKQSQNDFDKKQLPSTNKIKQYKAELSQYYWRDNLRNFYMQKNSTFHSGIKKIVQKQLIIKTLMNFFISRRTLSEEEVIIERKDSEEVQTPRSINSNRSRKRKEDSKAMLMIWQKILQDQQNKRRMSKQE